VKAADIGNFFTAHLPSSLKPSSPSALACREKKKALQEALNQHLIEEGKEPVEWEDEAQSARRADEHRSHRGEEPSSSDDKARPRVRRV
jgi:hypothetical protein